MAYITNTAIQERLGNSTYVQLADDDGDGLADVEVVDEVRLGAEGEVNSYLGQRFAVPIDLVKFPELAGVLKTISLDLAEHRLRVRRPPIPASAIRQRDQAIDWLARIAAGTLALPATGVPLSSDRSPIADSVGDARILSRDELSDF